MGFDNERLKHQGRLREAELQAQGLRLRCEGLIRSIRDCLDPFEPLTDMRCDVAAQQGVELAGLQVDYRQVVAEITQLKKALGL